MLTMKKWHVAVIVALMSFGAAVLFGIYRQTKGTSVVEALRADVDRANYCAADSDCSPLGPVCPFGCGLVVNRNERQRILDEIKAAPVTWDCFSVAYKCRSDLPVCVDGKCRYVK